MATKAQQRAANFRKRLKAHGLSHPEAAKRMGVRRETVWRWATGQVPISDRAHNHINAIFPP